MTTQFCLFLFNAGEHCAPMSEPAPPRVVLHARASGVRYDDNGLFVADEAWTVEGVQLAGQQVSPVPAFNYDFRYFNHAQRAASARAEAVLQPWLNKAEPARPPLAAGLVPSVVAVVEAGRVRLYHYMQQAESGALFLRLHDVPGALPAGWSELVELLRSATPKLVRAWPLFNDDCWYTKWRADIEMERKFTFDGIPDTWQLINDLYDEVLAGRLTGYVPELDREFQVFDYESHIFEVGGDPAEAGYISFIPQADGRMTVKRKWFMENSEIRRETVSGNHEIAMDDLPRQVAAMTGGQVRHMPPFRRKRFDVNFESLRTGNIFGVYFDICRTETPMHAFSQCEVEYCRSRTLWELRGVEEEFEEVAAYIRDFLERKAIAFRHDLFSKLDFVRQAHDMLSQHDAAPASPVPPVHHRA